MCLSKQSKDLISLALKFRAICVKNENLIVTIFVLVVPHLFLFKLMKLGVFLIKFYFLRNLATHYNKNKPTATARTVTNCINEEIRSADAECLLRKNRSTKRVAERETV